jgi:hypothetical protein
LTRLHFLCAANVQQNASQYLYRIVIAAQHQEGEAQVIVNSHIGTRDLRVLGLRINTDQDIPRKKNEGIRNKNIIIKKKQINK